MFIRVTKAITDVKYVLDNGAQSKKSLLLFSRCFIDFYLFHNVIMFLLTVYK